MRWGALLKLALGAVAMQVYCAPLRVLKREYVNVDANEVVEQQRRQEERLYEQYQDVLFLRMWLMFAVTLYALSGVVAKQVVVVIHVARSVSDEPPIVAMPSSSLLSVLYYWKEHHIESRHLKQFFQQHDAQFVPLVNRLLEEYTGNERLLYARIRRLYRDKKTSAHLKTP
uniref:RxLR effector protein n=1 Tax=Globisporangium ultimum (strain ATCC 200006 / CBS 805.95 / DAOM BR144) TaxID=431595 RepID=K3WEI9_GLOUD